MHTHAKAVGLESQKRHTNGMVVQFREWWQVTDVGFRHLMIKAYGFLFLVNDCDHLT